MKNWKTTIAGLVAAAAAGIKTQFPEYSAACDFVSYIAVLALGFFAADKIKG